MLYQLGCTLHMIRLSHLNTLLVHNVLTLLRERWHIYYFLELKGWRGVVSVSGSSLHSWERERFSIVYRGTKTKLITTANISKWYFQKEAARFLSKKKCGEATVPKLRLVFILHLIGYKGDANFWTNHKAKHSNTKTTLDYIIDTHLEVTQQVPNFKITDQLSYAD